MIDSKRLDAILEELYAIEPDLRAQSASLRRLVEELLARKPEAIIDEQFVARLRAELLSRAPSVSPQKFFMSFFTTKNTWYLAPGLAVALLAVAGSIILQRSNGSPTSTNLALAPARYERVASSAFGTLGATVPGTNAAPSPTRPMSGGGGFGSGPGMTADAKMVAPDWVPTIYRYSYTGEAVEGLPANVDVYRRVKGLPSSSAISALIDQSLGLVNLEKVRDGYLQSFTIAEKRDRGYVFNVDPSEGMVNIFQNGKWFSALARCMDQNCYEQNRLKESDLLSDEESIRIADAFLNEYGISKADYGEPIVNNQWRAQYAAMDAAARSSFWFPEGVSVVYPMLIDGKIAHDESGSPYGLNVNVDVRAKRAQSVWNLFTRNYEVSSYAAETDAKRLIGIAESTDSYNGVDMPKNTVKVDIELGTPTMAYVRAWQAMGDTGSELLVPALVFPVTKAPSDFWRQYVVVPLAKDLLNATPGNGQPMPVDLPAVQELK